MNLLKFIIDLVLKSGSKVDEKKAQKVYITLEMYKMGRDKQFPGTWTAECESNAIDLLERINGLLNELEWPFNVSVSSGFRPEAINSKTPNAAKRSAHQTGKACDILDSKNQDLAKLVLEKHPLLKKYGLMMEDHDYTRGQNSPWIHLDTAQRSERVVNVFKP